MKKIIALAVASAFVAPVMAAEVNISGEFITDYRDVDGTTSMNNDHAVNISATTETANGITVTGTVGMDGAADQESSNIKLAGAFGTLTIGDTSSVTDRIDSIADAAVMIGEDTSSESDANIAYVLPKFVEGLTVALSHSADGGADGAHNGQKGTGYGLDYSFGPVSVHYANLDNEDDSSESSYGLQAGFQGISFAYLTGEQKDDAGDVSEDTALMVSYEMGDVLVYAQNIEFVGSDDVVDNDFTQYGLQYSAGGGVTLFVEASDDSEDDTADTTSLGVKFKF